MFWIWRFSILKLADAKLAITTMLLQDVNNREQ